MSKNSLTKEQVTSVGGMIDEKMEANNKILMDQVAELFKNQEQTNNTLAKAVQAVQGSVDSLGQKFNEGVKKFMSGAKAVFPKTEEPHEAPELDPDTRSYGMRAKDSIVDGTRCTVKTVSEVLDFASPIVVGVGTFGKLQSSIPHSDNGIMELGRFAGISAVALGVGCGVRTGIDAAKNHNGTERGSLGKLKFNPAGSLRRPSRIFLFWFWERWQS